MKIYNTPLYNHPVPSRLDGAAIYTKIINVVFHVVRVR